jgi:hypothetical protein
MIKFILPIAAFIAAVYGISYFWTNSSSKGKKIDSFKLNNRPYRRYFSYNLP